MIGELIEEYGYTVSSIDGAAGAVCMAVADPEEGFFLELVPGGKWVAKRVADDEVECRPNCFGTQEIDFSDTKNFICSKNLRSYALENGLWKEGEPFNFTKIYGTGPLANDTYGGADWPVNRMRRWDCLHTLCNVDSDPFAKVYCAKPQRKLTARDVMHALTSTMEGTRFDLSLAPEAGVHHNPLWMTTSTSVGQGGTVVSMVYDLRPDTSPAAGCMWVACAAAKLAVYVPVFTAGEGLPEAYTWGECGEYDLGSAWWAFQEIGELCYRRYDEIANDLVIPFLTRCSRDFLKSGRSCTSAALRRKRCAPFPHAAAASAYAKSAGAWQVYQGEVPLQYSAELAVNRINDRPNETLRSGGFAYGFLFSRGALHGLFIRAQIENAAEHRRADDDDRIADKAQRVRDLAEDEKAPERRIDDLRIIKHGDLPSPGRGGTRR